MEYIKGLEGIIDRLSKFPDKLQQAAGKKSARRAMNVAKVAARAAAAQIDDPETREKIQKNIYLQQSRSQSRRVGGVVMRLGVLGGARRKMGPDPVASAQPGGDTRHWRYIELGTENEPARPFLRPALERNAEKITSVLVDELNKEINVIATGK